MKAVSLFRSRNLWRRAGSGSMLAVTMMSGVLIATAQVKNAWMTPQVGPVVRTQHHQSISTNALQAPHKAQAALQRAAEALRVGRDAEAGKQLERALQIYPRYALALLLRGVVKMRSDLLQEASADFQQAIQFDPSLGAAYVELGSIYNQLGNFSDAVSVLNCATFILPNAWLAHYESALAYLGSGRIEPAWRAISRALENLPEEPDNRSAILYIKAQVLLDLENYADAKTAFQQSVNEDPQGRFARLAQQVLDRLNAQQEPQTHSSSDSTSHSTQH